MALGSLRQITSSPALGFQKTFKGAFWDRIVCSEVDPCGARTRKDSPRASNQLRAIRRHPTEFASSQVGCGAVTLYAEPQMELSMTGRLAMEDNENGADADSDDCEDEKDDEEDIVTELQRSLLESQWVSTDQADPSGTIPCSHRLSARQRRRSRKRGSSARFPPSDIVTPSVSSSTKSLSNVKRIIPRTAGSPSTKSLNDINRGIPSIAGYLESVDTLGLMRACGKRALLTREEEVILSKKMKVGQNLRAARKKITKILGHEPSDEMWAKSVKLPFREMQSKLREADRARDYMFLCNLRLVVSVASKYSSLGISLVDLIQEGAVGLLRGLEKFDYRRGFKLSTYVHWWIRQGVTRALAQNSKMVRVPAYMQGRMAVLNRMMTRFKMNGMRISVETLSDALNMPDETVVVALKATKKTTSLDKTKRWGNFNPEKDSLHNYVADPSIDNNPWHMVDKMSLREDVEALLSSALSEREQDIIRLYYGFDCANGQGMSFEKIGQRIGISRERTRQVEGCALRKLVIAGRQVGMGVPLIE